MEVVKKAEEIVDLPPGFRFHPTDEEIITCYLTEKVMNNKFSAVAIGEADLNKCEPWDLQEKAKIGENEWYFFFRKDRKYPTGMRTNRATEAGYWKATGKDKEIFKGKGYLVGMKKTLVFYKGRAPKGEKTNWVMHEFRLEGNLPYHPRSRSAKDEWVVCRVYHKPIGPKKNPIDDHILRMNSIDDMNNFLDYSSLPPLMDPSSLGLPGSNSAGDQPEFKPMRAQPPPPPPQLITMNQNYLYHPHTNILPQSSMTTTAMLNPQIQFQNPKYSPFTGAIQGVDFGQMGIKSNGVSYKAEQISSIQSGLSGDMKYNTVEISSKQQNIIGSKSYEDFPDLGNIWDY